MCVCEVCEHFPTALPPQAALCAACIVNKVPDLMEVYVPTTRQLLNEKNHGVLITGVCLVTQMCLVNPDSLNHFKRVCHSIQRRSDGRLSSTLYIDHVTNYCTTAFLEAYGCRTSSVCVWGRSCLNGAFILYSLCLIL